MLFICIASFVYGQKSKDGVPRTPKELLMKSYFEIKDKKSVEYNVMYRTTTSVDKYQHTAHAKAYIQRRITNEEDNMAYFWVSPIDSYYFFYDLSSVYSVDRGQKIAIVFEAPFFFNSHIMTTNGVPLTELLWSSFFTPDKLVDKAENASLQIDKQYDTVINGVSCYQLLIKFPDDAKYTDHRLTMCFNKSDYMPIYLFSFIRHDGIYEYSFSSITDYVFDKVDPSKFTKSQIPGDYKIENYKPQLTVL